MRLAPAATLAVLWLSGSVPAQQTLDLTWNRNVPNQRQIRASVEDTIASARIGGCGWIRVDLLNRDAEAHRVDIRLEQSYSATFEVTRSVGVEPNAGRRIHLPLPSLGVHATVRFAVDGYDNGSRFSCRTTSDRALGVAALLVSDAATTKPGWKAMLESRLLSLPPTSTPQQRELSLFALRPADRLPPDWTMLSGFDLVVVDGRARDLDAEVQRVLRDYLRAGGNLFLVWADSLPAGPLGEALSRGESDRAPDGSNGIGAEVRRGRVGFGGFFALGTDLSAVMPGGPLPAAAAERLSDWLEDGGAGVLGAGTRIVSAPLDHAFYSVVQIPGLGEVPLRAFLVLILLFAALVGPINYFYWKRRRRLTMLLCTVPALGFGTTLLILGYGLLSEGLGIKGVARSLTMLDQAAHEAVSWGSRTLYAGLSPNSVRPASGTYLFCNQCLGRGYRGGTGHRLSIDLDHGGRFDGSILPSRTPTCLATLAQGTARERMRFRRRGDGGVDLLAGPQLRPTAGAGTVLMRDRDGDYYRGGADGRLQRVNEREALAAFEELTARWVAVTVPWPEAGFDIGYSHGVRDPGGDRLRALVTSRLGAGGAAGGAGGLAPGSYLALVEAMPSFDELGLDVEWLAAAHLVLGRLAEEDVLD